MGIPSNSYKERVSAAITWLRFPLILCVVMLHCYCTVPLTAGNHTLFFKIVYPMGLWLGETGVPGFFFTSGFLFFISKKSYGQKLATRAHTLLIPYLLWNAILLALYLLAYAAGYPQNINYRSITEYQFIDYIRLFWDRGTWDNGNFVPLLCPFWYIRNLLIMSVLSPLLYYIIRYGGVVFLLTVAAWWMMTYHNAFISQTIFFFSLGAYFSIRNFNPLELFYRHRQLIFFLFLLFALTDFATHSYINSSYSLQVYRLALIINIPALILLADYCNNKEFASRQLPNATFIVFAVHYPIVVILRKICIAQFSMAADYTHILLYFLCIIASTAISLSIYIILNKYFPKLKNILSGNR